MFIIQVNFILQQYTSQTMSDSHYIIQSFEETKINNKMPSIWLWENSDFLQLYKKDKKNDDLSKSISIVCNDGVWNIYLIECTTEGTTARSSEHLDRKVYDKSFNFPSIQKIKDRIKRMDKNFHIE